MTSTRIIYYAHTGKKNTSWHIIVTAEETEKVLNQKALCGFHPIGDFSVAIKYDGDQPYVCENCKYELTQ